MWCSTMEKSIRISRLTLLAFLLLLTTCLSSVAFGQVKEFDNLEQLYDQGHFELVHRRAKKLKSNPKFDYSLVPQYYVSISTLQRLQNKGWRDKHTTEIEAAFVFLSELKKKNKGSELLEAHMSEIRSLQMDLEDWVANLYRGKASEIADVFAERIQKMNKAINLPDAKPQSNDWISPENALLSERISYIDYAKKYLGTPYVWSGDSPSGFDCSGFTSYVFSHFGKVIPRVSKDQFAQAQKIDSSEAMIGDLVFFGLNNVVSHVGILVNEAGKPKRMIHSSSSKGVSFQDIEGSKYYTNRLIGFGRY